MDKDVKNWCDISAYDMATAEAMYKTGRYLYVLFMCQQAVEKLLKGLALKETGEIPPRTHDLDRLVKLCSLNLDENQSKLIHNLTAYYIETRYPEDIRHLGKDINKELVYKYFKETKGLLKWLKEKMK